MLKAPPATGCQLGRFNRSGAFLLETGMTDSPTEGIIATAFAKMDAAHKDGIGVDTEVSDIVAKALLDAAKEFGLSADVSQSPVIDGGRTVRCLGKMKENAATGRIVPDVAIEFEVPPYGFGGMNGYIERGFETHGMSVKKLMHAIVAAAYRKCGIIMLQTADVCNFEVAADPDFYAKKAAATRQRTMQPAR